MADQGISNDALREDSQLTEWLTLISSCKASKEAGSSRPASFGWIERQPRRGRRVRPGSRLWIQRPASDAPGSDTWYRRKAPSYGGTELTRGRTSLREGSSLRTTDLWPTFW